jgi:2-oxo-4-hydroxy-4-carboxy-5-ureidoimidazoline decarboxylase
LTTLTLAQVNAMPADEFVRVFGGVYEHSPWVAVIAEQQRPYATFEQLQIAMRDAVARSADSDKLALIRAHPALLGKLATFDQLTAASRAEQASAGLDHCSADELAQLAKLNQAYRDRFGFPFVVAVRGLTRAQIIERMQTGLHGTRETEFSTCLAEIDTITHLRLLSLVSA